MGVSGLDIVFTPCQLCPCLKGLYGHLQSQHIIYSAEANKDYRRTQARLKSQEFLKKKKEIKKSIYTLGRAHITSKHTVFIQIYKKEKEKIQQNKYIINTSHREISVPTETTWGHNNVVQ